MMLEKPILIVMVGPTAVGKTATAISLAELISGEIVSADSRLLYKGMNIGTAKPTHKEMGRIPHHLVDVTTPDRSWSLAQYKNAANNVINDIQQRRKIPLLVGGTGQYVRAITEGWDIPPIPRDNTIRDELVEYAEREGSSSLHTKLMELDRKAAETIDPRNIRRIIRALEVCISTGKPFSQLRTKTKPSYDIFVVGLTMKRSELYMRIDARIDRMFTSGWVEEVSRLIKQGCTSDMSSMSALGYREVIDFINGDIDFAETKRRIRKASRRLVRRQASWFSKNDMTINWYEMRDLCLGELHTNVTNWIQSIS
ncbi:MAG: tRNA (adenosine(37)-N6)-dimethylallyltransferase MiaA [Anaerolineaceae bacterium]|nr:tRNA (adenosine(37)-N6)-dimethylallyltransferase MiaA [Anaerolineaceae bacterium]